MLATDLTAHVNGTIGARGAARASPPELLHKFGLLANQIVVYLLPLVVRRRLMLLVARTCSCGSLSLSL